MRIQVWDLSWILFKKLSIEANNLVDLRNEQEKAVNCFSEGTNVFAVMPAEQRKSFIFQLFATAVIIKKVCQGQHSNTEGLVSCLQTSMIQDYVKEGKTLSVDCA